MIDEFMHSVLLIDQTFVCFFNLCFSSFHFFVPNGHLHAGPVGSMYIQTFKFLNSEYMQVYIWHIQFLSTLFLVLQRILKQLPQFVLLCIQLLTQSRR
jgi:hypothetical protein